MNILFLSHTFPYPLNEGTRVLVYNILKVIAERHKVYLICLNDQEVEEIWLEKIQQLGVTIFKIDNLKIPKLILKRLLNVIFDPVPFCVRQFESDNVRQAIQKCLSEYSIDVVHIEYISMAIYQDELNSLPALFFPHDAVSLLFQGNIKAEKNILRKIYTWSQWKKIIRFEKRMIPKFDQTIVVAPRDKEHLEKMIEGSAIQVIPMGIDYDYFQPSDKPTEDLTILFRGVMDFMPNEDAANYFCESIFPIVKKEIPNAKFIIVGKNPSQRLLEKSSLDKGIFIAGYVEDIRIPMAKASLIVCPMRVGSGIKLKILESFAMQKAIVATSLACSGIDVIDGEHVLIANEKRAFAEKVILLLKNKKLREHISKQGFNYAKQNYSWCKTGEMFEYFYKKIANV